MPLATSLFVVNISVIKLILLQLYCLLRRAQYLFSEYQIAKRRFSCIFHGDTCYFRHGQGCDDILQYFPVAHNNYTVVFFK